MLADQHSLTQMIATRVSPAMRADLAAVAEREGLSTSEWVRRTLQSVAAYRLAAASATGAQAAPKLSAGQAA